MISPHVKPFIRRHPECLTGQTAAGNCFDVSQAYLKYVREDKTERVEDTDIIMLEGYLGDISKSVWKKHHPLALHHTVVRVRLWYVDWTAKQLDETHTIPRIITREQLETEWALIRKYC